MKRSDVYEVEAGRAFINNNPERAKRLREKAARLRVIEGAKIGPADIAMGRVWGHTNRITEYRVIR